MSGIHPFFCRKAHSSSYLELNRSGCFRLAGSAINKFQFDSLGIKRASYEAILRIRRELILKK